MNDFAIIPALDLKGGAVVHARGGARADIPADRDASRRRRRSGGASLAPSSPSPALPSLYIADLDAIEGVGNHFERLPRSRKRPSGQRAVDRCRFLQRHRLRLLAAARGDAGHRQESLSFAEDWQELRAAFGESLVLSLDFGAEGRRGPSALFADPAHWPERIIAMSLDRVGTGHGPDVARLRDVVEQAGAALGLCVRRHARYRRPRSRRRGGGRRGADRHGAASRRRHAKKKSPPSCEERRSRIRLRPQKPSFLSHR